MAGLKFKLDKQTYEVDCGKITLGEGRFLKQRFGMTSYDELTIIDPDPDILVGILAVALKRKHPELGEDEIVARVEALPQADFFVPMLTQLEAEVAKAREAEKDPQSPGGNGSAPGKASSSATTPKRPGPKASANGA